MSPSELKSFVRLVRIANNICRAELAAAQTPPPGYAAALAAKRVRRVATESLRVFRPVERALQGYYQAMFFQPRAKAGWLMQVRVAMAKLAHLCRHEQPHHAYAGMVLPFTREEMGEMLNLAPSERVALRNLTLKGADITPSTLTSALALGRAADIRGGRRPAPDPEAAVKPQRNNGKRMVALLARDLSDEAFEALVAAAATDTTLEGLKGVMDAVAVARAGGKPLISVEASLRFRLECAEDKVRQLEEENRELRGKLRGAE